MRVRIKTNKTREYDKEYQAKRRAENPEWKAEQNRLYKLNNPEKCKAQDIINHHIRKGEIERLSCEVCGRQDTHAHHEDYSKPLEVIWLCPSCHKKWHLRYK